MARVWRSAEGRAMLRTVAEARGSDLRSLVLRGNLARGERPSVSLLQASCWLALILVITKAVTLGWSWNLPRRFFLLVMASWTDVLFAITCGLIAEATVRAVERWPVVATALRALFLGFFALCAAYGVAAIGLYRYFN